MATGGLRVEGQTLEEAVRKAAALLEVLPEELVVEVLDAGKQGLFGFGRRPAVIMAWPPGEDAAAAAGADTVAAAVDEGLEPGAGPAPATPEVEAPADETATGPGMARVENGRIIITGGEPPATIISGEKFALVVNGRPAPAEVTVRPDDEVTVQPLVEKKEGEWKLVVAADGLEAKVIVKPGYERTWRLKDQFPSSRLELLGEEVKEPLPAVTPEELLAELDRQQVTFGRDAAAIEMACRATAPVEIIVARGRPPRPPEDARVEYLFSTSETARREVGEEERVDYREMVVRASVAVDELLAAKVPPRPGEAGMTVTGKVIPPPEPRDIELVAGKGTRVIDGQRCVATAEGRPQLRQRRGQVIIDIIPVLLHRGDVDLSSGNLKFKGGINITGSVTETMQVVASQDIEIGGDVTQATVSSGGSILIRRNCIGSVLIAGGNNSVFLNAEPILTELGGQLSLLRVAAGQLEKGAREQKGAAGHINTGYMMAVLVENKFKQIPALAARLGQLTRGLEGGPEEQKLAQLGRDLAGAFRTPATIQGLSVARLEKLMAAVQEMAAYCREIPPEGGDVTVSYALNSKIQASGQVKITGRGCFNTEIVAGGKVEIQGVFRGGIITAGDNIYIHEMGSGGGARTRARVAEGKLIKAGKIWPNSTLQIGKRIRQIDNEELRVMAYLNSEGDMVLGTF